MAMNPRLLRPTANDSPASIPGLALWLDASASDALYTTDAGPVTAVSSPLDISGCALWLDASDASTISDTAGAVDQWDDKSGNDNHATATTTARPTTGAATQNGLNVLSFDGANTWMEVDGLAAIASGSDKPLTAIAVVRPNAVALNACLVAWSHLTLTGPYQDIRTTATSWQALKRDDASASGTAAVSATAISAGVWSVVTYGHTGISASIAEGGAVSATSSQDVGACTLSKTTICGRYSASTLTYGQLMNADIAEIIVYDSALSASDRARVEAYLAAKWGISGVHAPAVTASDPVGYWRDRSGTGLTAVTADATKRPLVATVNGRRALDFDGVNDTLTIQGYTAENGLTGLTRFAVAFLDASAGTILLSLTDSGVNYRGGARFIDSQSGNVQFSAGSSGFTIGSVNVANTGYTLLRDAPHVLGSTYDGTKATLEQAILAHYDGATLTPTSTSGAVYSPLVSGGTRLHIGSNVNANNWWNGKICEYLVYNRVLTAAQRRKVERYLARRWGITLAPQVSNAEAQDWINRVYTNGGTVSQSTASAVSTMCDAIESAGIRDRFYRLNLFCGDNLNAALVPLYRGPTRRTDRNLLATVASSVQVSGAGWLELSATKGALVAAPNGAQTAQSVTFTNGAVRTTTAWTPNAIGTVSLWARSPASGGATHIRITTNNTVAWNTGISEKFALSTSWQRISATGALSTGTGVHVIVGGSTITGAGDADCNGVVELWSPQLEFGSLSDYEGPQYGNTVDQSLGSPSFVGVGTDYAETGASGGLKPNGSSKYLATGLLANALTQSGRHLSVWTDMATSVFNRYWFGTDNVGCGSNAYWAIGSSSTSQAEYRAGVPGAGSIGSVSGKIHVLVSGNGTAQSYVNGIASTSTSGTAFTAPAQEVFIGALNRCGSPADYGSSRFAAYSIGDSMSSAQALAFYQALAAFQTSLSRI